MLFLLYTLVWPWINRSRTNQSRFQRIRTMEQKRGSRVITMIHRQEAFSLLGFPIARYINIEDSEHILRAIRFTPDNMKSYGLPVRAGLPREVYELMELFPQPAGRRPSVQYVPVPYHAATARDEVYRRP